ncbi:MAG TPA: hypothetical protein VF787_01690 [Thermoanaerobaculia bacterium]
MRTALLCLALFAATSVAASESYVSSLPVGRVKVDVMKTVTAPRAAELTAKLQAAVQADGEQWREEAQSAKADERLSWNERLGLTREENEELQRSAAEVTLVKMAEAEVEFVRTADGRLVLQPDSSLPELAGVVIDLNHDAIDTPFGRTTERADIVASAWSGVQWKLEVEGDELSAGTSVKLAIGRTEDDGRVILNYDAKQVDGNHMPRRASCVIVLH